MTSLIVFSAVDGTSVLTGIPYVRFVGKLLGKRAARKAAAVLLTATAAFTAIGVMLHFGATAQIIAGVVYAVVCRLGSRPLAISKVTDFVLRCLQEGDDQ